MHMGREPQGLETARVVIEELTSPIDEVSTEGKHTDIYLWRSSCRTMEKTFESGGKGSRRRTCPRT